MRAGGVVCSKESSSTLYIYSIRYIYSEHSVIYGETLHPFQRKGAELRREREDKQAGRSNLVEIHMVYI